MHARLLLFNIKPRKGSKGKALANKLNDAFKTLKGFESATYLNGDTAVGSYAVLVLWKSFAEAVAGKDLLLPKLREVMNSRLEGPICYPLFEVIEPKKS
jgi:hypothetical protein